MIRLLQLSLMRGTKPLFEGAELTLNPGEKIGLIGSNGSGKSTLFAMLRDELHPDQGSLDFPRSWRVAHVAQETPALDRPAVEYAIDGDATLRTLERELALIDGSDTEGQRIAELHAHLADAGAYTVRSRAEQLLTGLGFTHQQMMLPVSSFSGGWRMRLNLAQALICPSDLLLLDEPTNHLDLDAILWLEDWLKRYAGTLIVISHDRDFLDGVTNVIVHIDERKLKRYSGNYSAFERQRAAQLELAQAMLDKQQRKRAHLQSFIDRFKAKATKAKQAQSRVKALERMEKIAPVLASADFTFEFREPDNLPNPMLAITDAAFGYRGDDGHETAILSGVNRSVLAGQRIGILGANGQGKSTLVKTVARTMAPLAGRLTEGKGLRIGYFAQQELDVLRAPDNPLEHMVRLAREQGLANSEAGREQELRNFLGSFNFSGDMVQQRVGTMSGGEKARLVLAMIVWQKPNLLLLDEPTNHLDLATREALAMALNEFEGTVMLVSHDRALLRSVCDEFWLVGRGRIEPFDGDLEDYQRHLLDESRRLREEARKISAGPTTTPAQRMSGSDQRKQEAARRQQLAVELRPLRKELESIEQRLPRLQEEKSQLELRLSTAMPAGDIAQAGRRLKVLGEELAQLEDRWLQLSEQIELMASGC